MAFPTLRPCIHQSQHSASLVAVALAMVQFLQALVDHCSAHMKLDCVLSGLSQQHSHSIVLHGFNLHLVFFPLIFHHGYHQEQLCIRYGPGS